MFKNTKGQWDWFKILLPIIMLIFVGLTKTIYDNICDSLTGKANAKEVVLHIADLKKDIKTKAKESDLKQMLLLFEQRTKVLEESDKIKAIEQKAVTKELQELNLNLKILQIQNEKD